MFVQMRSGFPLTESFYRDTTALEAALMKEQSPQIEETITKVQAMLLRGKGRAIQAWTVNPNSPQE